MKKIQRILAATDFSPRAERAVRRAAQVAIEHEAELYLLHVLPVFPLEAFKHLISKTPLETEQHLYNQSKLALQQEAETLTRSGIRVKRYVAIGRAHIEISRYAESHHADLIVIGDQGETFAQELFLGTTASKTLRKGHHPLLIIKREPKDQYRHVLVPVDFSPPSLEALDVALSVVTQASIHVLHGAEMPFERKMKQIGFNVKDADLFHKELLNHARQRMERLLADRAAGNTRVISVIEPGDPPVVIREKAQSLGVDLIVIGKRGETELDEALFGSVTKHVLYETSCDVLVVNPEK